MDGMISELSLTARRGGPAELGASELGRSELGASELGGRWAQALREAEPPPPPAGGAVSGGSGPAGAVMGDLAARQALAAHMVKGNATTTPEDTRLVSDHLARTMPLSEMQALNAHGITIKATQGNVTTELPSLKNDQPRSWSAESRWSTVPGTYWAPTREVVIATQGGPGQKRTMPGEDQSSSADVLLHEAAHGLNRIGDGLRSDGEEFRVAYAADAGGHGTLSAPYYHQQDASAGRDEAYAESNAMYLRTPAQLRTESPAMFAYWDKHLGR